MLARSGTRMRSRLFVVIVSAACASTVAAVGGGTLGAQSFPTSGGSVRTLATNGTIDRRNKFFQPVGKQFAVTCEHCHFASDAWSVSVEHIRQLFDSTRGRH